MLIPPKYRLTNKISELLSSIEASKEVIDSLTLHPKIEMNIRRESTLKSSLYSARIEGNPLTLNEIIGKVSQNQKKLEIFNILKALNLVREKGDSNLTTKDILTYHKIIINGLGNSGTPGLPAGRQGKFRSNMEAIFNSAGIAIYMPPPPSMISSLIDRLIKYTNNLKERFIPIRAVLTHYSFEKIHPFLDGSGRVGRLLIQRILFQGGYGMKGIIPLEEYLDLHRSEYYRMLEEPEKDATDYIEFMLEAIAETAKKAKLEILAKQEPNVENMLLPRRAEIYRIVKEQKMVNFDRIRRRFAQVNERTLRYDLKSLQDEKLIRKLGTTKGVYYTPNEF